MEAASFSVRGGPAHTEARREVLLDRLIPLFVSEGFLDCGLEDMARKARCSKSSLYIIGDTKNQIIVAVVRAFFRRATASIAGSVDPNTTPVARIHRYLTLIAESLAPASPRFFEDLDAYAPARDIYQQNTRIAADIVRALVLEAMGPSSPVDAEFVGMVAGLVMNAIHRKEVEAQTGLDDASAYRALATLIVAGVSAPAGHDPHHRPEGDYR